MFEKRILALNHKMLAAMNGESINVCLSAVLSMLVTVAQNVDPQDKFVIGACLEDCMKIMGVTDRIDTIQ